MTTRNQKKREAKAQSKPSSSIGRGVDSEKLPVVALPAPAPHSSRSDVDRNGEANLNLNGNQLGPSNLEKSLSAATLQNPSSLAPPIPPASADALKNSSSPARPATPATVAAVKPPITTTSNPVLRDICDLKSGELKIVSPAVSKYFGFPAGPVEKLNFNDPKVAEFFNLPLNQPAAAVNVPVPVSDASVPGTREEAAALVPVSGPVAVPSSTTATVTSTPAAPLIPHASPAAVSVNACQKDGVSARPARKAADNTTSSTHTTPPATTWSGLFKNNRALNEDTKMNSRYTGVTSDDVDFDPDDLYDDDEEKRSLIGFFNGKFPGTNAIQRIVDDWSRKCSFHQHNSGWLVFTFEEEGDCDVVMQEGPYYAFNKPLVLKKMPEYFDYSDEAYSTAPVWIQLPNLPLRAWKKPALEKICTFLGTPLHIDLVTKEKTQISFARCLVEVDVSKELPNLVCCKYPGGKVLRHHVLYEEVPTFCSNCKKLGHDTEDCYVKNNGAPSLYVTKSKKDREKMSGSYKSKGGLSKGAVSARQNQGLGKAAGHVSGHGSGPVSGQVAAQNPRTGAAAPLTDPPAAKGVGSGQVYMAKQTGNMGGRPPTSTPNNMTLANNKGKSTETNAKAPGFVSNNSFGPLANEKIGSWANEAEASNAKNGNNKKSNNDKNK